MEASQAEGVPMIWLVSGCGARRYKTGGKGEDGE